jgi:hypothetical protein
MKWLSRLSALLFGLITLGMARDLLEKNRILVVSGNDVEFDDEDEELDIKDLSPLNYNNAMDLRGTPTHECVCGCNIWNVKVIFSEYQIATYFLDMECANCGSLATAPTPVDIEGMEN